MRARDRYGLRHRSVFVRAVMTRPTALRKSALEGRGVVVLLSSSSSSGGVVLRAVVVPHPAHFPESVLRSIHFLSLSLSLSLSEKRRKRRLLLATVTSVAGMKSSIVCARSLSLSASQKVATKRVNLKPLLFSPFQTSGKRSKTPQSSLFYTARITRKTFARRKRRRERERERDDDATRREEASPRIHRPNAFFFFFFFFFFHPRRGRIFAL